MRRKNIWILGAGKFGKKAAEAINQGFPDARITVIDNQPERLDSMSHLSDRLICSDGIQYLVENLSGMETDPDWIIPSAPVHVVCEWVKMKLADSYRLKRTGIPEDLLSRLPNPIVGQNGEIYMSFADFICPDNCPEPADICTFTGQPRLGTLYKLLEELNHHGFRSIVVRSRQLFPGVGGYSPGVMLSAMEEVVNTLSPFLISTACRCHGVMNALTIERVQ